MQQFSLVVARYKRRQDSCYPFILWPTQTVYHSRKSLVTSMSVFMNSEVAYRSSRVSSARITPANSSFVMRWLPAREHNVHVRERKATGPHHAY